MRTTIKKGEHVEIRSIQYKTLLEDTNLASNHNMELVMDVTLEVIAELGRTHKTIKEIMELTAGSIIQLDKVAGEPVKILANGKTIAEGEVVIIDESYGIRITKIIKP